MPARRKKIMPTETPTEIRLLTTAEVAEWLRVSTDYVAAHASGRCKPKLPGIKLGSRNGKGLWRFAREDVEAFIRAMHN
jgi:hypothetical protein